MKWCSFLLFLCLGACRVGWGNSVNLFNNTDYKLKAVVFSADATVLDEVILDAKDASTWADDFYQFGYDPSATRTPYTVQWYCMGGQSFGVCENVASGSIVLAQSCSQGQGCPEEGEE